MADSQSTGKEISLLFPHSFYVLIYPDLLPTGSFTIPFTTYTSDATQALSTHASPLLILHIIQMILLFPVHYARKDPFMSWIFLYNITLIGYNELKLTPVPLPAPTADTRS